MDKLLPLTCYIFVVSAAGNSGYNYQQQNVRTFPSGGNNGIYSNQQAPPFAPQYSQQPIAAPSSVYGQPSGQFLGSSQQSGGFSQSQQSGGFSQSQQSGGYSQQQQQTIISKDIYIHSAPEETEEINNVFGGSDAGPIRKNYRIVFIKAPSHNIRFNTQYTKGSQSSNEEKTIIYVLAKKPDIENIKNEVAAPQSQQKASKPEVYFIRYKTQDEANRAQQEIQAQYESLGGSTQISDEGIAPVTSVIGNGGGGGGGGGGAAGGAGANFVQSASNIRQSYQGGQGGGFGFDSPSNKYLPAKAI